jgi:hypothetical protein
LREIFDDFGYVVASQIDTQNLSGVGSHAYDVVYPDPIDDQEVVVVTTDHETPRAAMHTL